MTLIDSLNYKASLFNIIQNHCVIETHENGFYLKPINERMKNMFGELGFTTPVDCKEFCRVWEINSRAIWKHWHNESTYSGCVAFEYYDAFVRRYYDERRVI